jgi:hypothetical protein
VNELPPPQSVRPELAAGYKQAAVALFPELLMVVNSE